MKSRADFEEREPLLSQDQGGHDRHQSPPVATTKCTDIKTTKKCVFASKLSLAALGMIVVATALCFISDSNGTPLKYHLLNYYDTLFGGYGSDNPTFACSGHGVKVYGDKCLCDLGYIGNDCSNQSPKNIDTPKPETICLVIDTFGSLGSSIDGLGQANSELALSLAKAGYSVTILYIGQQNPQFPSVANTYANKGVFVTRLPQTGLDYGDNQIESTSYSVYQFILQSASKFSHVYFSSSTGSGYYTLLAQSQGLLCSNTVFINGMDTLPVEINARINSGDADVMVTDKTDLKLDYFMKKSAELADINVLSSNAIFNEILAANWAINKENTHVLNKPAPKYSLTKATSESVQELVFVGSMTNAGGLKVFCDAIDSLIQEIQAEKIKITFVGSSGRINDMKSEEYIELRSLNWDAFEVAWSIRVVDDLEEIAKYASGKGRLAVYPALNDPVGTLAQTLIQSKIPIVLSGNSAAKEILAASDKLSIVVDADGVSFAAKIKTILNTDVAPYAKTVSVVTASKWMELLETKTPKTCNNAYSKLSEQPLVSVVLVHHNRHHLLKQAIAALDAQTYKNFEVIVVDDGSTDPMSLAYIRELSWKWWETKGWKVLFETNRYLGAARNTGARAAAGKYVVFLDDDDYSKPHHIETLIKVAINTDADIVTGGHDVFNGRQRPSSGISNSRFIPAGPAPLVGMLQNVFGDSAMMVRRDYFIDLGGFSEDFGVGFEDYEFLARAAIKGHNLQSVPESLHWYRHHGKTMSTTTNLKTNQLRMLRPYIEANPTASASQRAVFEQVQKEFFEKYGVSFNENPFARRDNSTVVPVTPLNPYVVYCDAFTDSTGSSAIVVTEQPVWVNSVKSACWNMGANSAPVSSNANAVNVNQAIQPIYPDGSTAGYPIVLTMPCASQYSDVWNVIQVIVAQNTPYNKYRTFNASMTTGAPSYGYYNRPLVPPGTTVDASYSSNPPKVQPAWSNGGAVYFIDFGLISVANAWDNVVSAGKIVDVSGAGPVASDASSVSTGFYSLARVNTAGIPRYQTGDYRAIEQLTHPYVPTPVLNAKASNVPMVLNCPFVASENVQTLPNSHKTYLFGLEPEIAPKTAGVTVVLWGMSFTSSSTVYLNGLAHTGKVNLISNQYLSIVVDFTQFSGATGTVTIYVDDSIPYVVRYYETPAIVSAVTAGSTLYTKAEGQTLKITGQNLPQLSGGFCVFNTTANGIATPLTVTSATTAQCSLPYLETSGVYTVGVAMSASKYNVPQLGLVQGNFYTFPLLAGGGGVTVYAKGPKAVAAQFSNNGASIYVDVDTPASVIDVNQFITNKKVIFVDSSIPMPCSSIFQTSYDGTSTPPTGKLGNNPNDCLVQQLTATRFKILLQAQFAAYDAQAIVPSNLIKILVGSLWATNQRLVEVYASSAVVAGPAVVPVPSVSIVAPAFVPRCEGIAVALDLTASSGSAGRNYTAGSTLTVVSSVSMDPNSPTGQTLNNFLAACVANINLQGVCQIPLTLLGTSSSPSTTYTFTLTLKNYLGGVSSQSAVVTVGADATTPFVTIVGVPQTNVKVNQVQVLNALGTPSCGVSTAIKYQWSATGASCPGLQDTLVSGASAQLVIPAFTLKPQTTCVLTLKVQYAGQSSWLSTTTTFNTATEIIGVSAGNSRTLGVSQTVVVDATLYSDSFNVGTAGQYKCAWTCLNSHGFLCASSVTKLLNGCSSNVLTGQVTPDTYSLKVSVLDSLTGVSASSKYPAKLTIGGVGVPSVKITLPSQSTSSFSNKFSLNAVVDPATVSSLANVKYSWSACNDATYSSLNFTNANNFLTDTSSAQVLKFSPGALLGDTTYCVGVTVRDGASTATTQITFETYETPFGGFCFLQTASIKALNQPLQYSCPYWAVDSSAQPLTYQFYVRTNASNPWTLVVPTDRSSLMSSTFVTGQYQIKVVVADEYGSTASGVASAFSAADNSQLSAAAETLQCSTKVCVQLQQALATYNQTQNSVAMAQAIGSAALLVDIKSPDFVTILSLLNQYSDNVYVDTAATGPFLASVLQVIAGDGYNIPSSVVPQFFKLVKSVIKQITENGKNEYPPNCVDTLSAESMFLVLDQTLGSQKSLGLTDEQRAECRFRVQRGNR
ncbi:hypothetical protein BDR26DRAFT_47834 [Obelidium mucronatum]|nr:hypothetical protein BDR26DRAFT_47834 [Obelidium mucronatum]